MNAPSLTPRQQEVLMFMAAYFFDNDQLPSNKAITENFGWKSDNNSWLHTNALERKGLIERNAANKFRFARGCK